MAEYTSWPSVSLSALRPRRRRPSCWWRPPRPASACRIRCSTRRSNSGPAPRLPPRSALPCRPGTSSTDRLVVGAPGAEEVFVLKGQSLGRVGELTEASAGLPRKPATSSARRYSDPAHRVPTTAGAGRLRSVAAETEEELVEAGSPRRGARPG